MNYYGREISQNEVGFKMLKRKVESLVIRQKKDIERLQKDNLKLKEDYEGVSEILNAVLAIMFIDNAVSTGASKKRSETTRPTAKKRKKAI